MVQVVTLIRFSFLSSTDKGYRLAKGASLHEKAIELFAEERLQRRFELFERICLPSLRAQPDGRFHAIILASAALPEPYKKRLQTAVESMKNVLIAFEEPMPMPYEELWLKHISRIEGLHDIFATSRLDDDDALSPDFTASLAPYLSKSYLGHAISFPLGLQCAMVNGAPRFWESYWPLIAAGLSFVTSKQELSTVFSLRHHHHIPRKRPVVLDARSAQYVVSLHQQNDSQVGKGHPLGQKFPALRRLKRSIWRRPAHMLKAEERRIPAELWNLEEAERRMPELSPVLRGCDWTCL